MDASASSGTPTPKKKKSLGVRVGIITAVLFCIVGMTLMIKNHRSEAKTGTAEIVYGQKSLNVAGLLTDKESETVVLKDGDRYNHGGETHYVFTSKKVRLISTLTGKTYQWSGWKAIGEVPSPEENEFTIFSTDGTPVEVTFEKQ